MSKNQTLDDAYREILDELLNIFLKKHKDYGKGNILSIKELGIAFRLTEKIERLKNLLMNSKKPENESIEDTLNDIAVYAIIARLYRDGKFEKLSVREE